MRSLFIGASLALLTACSSTNPFMTAGGTGGTGTSSSLVPDALKGDLRRISYSPGAGTITVEGIRLDETEISTTYRRNAALDMPGYQAYTAQDDPLDRHSTALVAQSRNSGAVRAGVVVTGGQFNTVFAGNYFERTGGYAAPAVGPNSGLVSYAGNYAGLLNGGGDGADLLPVPAGTPPAITPSQAGTVSGQIFLNADFADNSVNGAIYNRNWNEANGGAGQALPDIVLIPTEITADGVFEGTTEYDGVVGETMGAYGGIFGGPSAEAVGGAVVLEEWDGQNDPLGLDSELEWGVFVLDQCGTPDANLPICATVNPGAGVP